MYRATSLAVALAAGLVLGACSPPPPPPAPAGPDQSYTVRGEIARLPDPADPQHEIWIRHEAIPDFATEEGQVVGMVAMTMPFGLDEGVDLAGLEVGGKIRFTLEVRWADRAQPAKVVAVEALPAETELVFAPREPAPQAAEPAPAPESVPES